jgi:ribosomal protein S18 acetylase RimI-like enzyme
MTIPDSRVTNDREVGGCCSPDRSRPSFEGVETPVVVGDAPVDDVAGIVEVFPQPDRVLVRLHLAEAGGEDFVVARLDGAIRGIVSVKWAGGCDPPHPWIYGAEVSPASRGRGIGTALWDEAERRCSHRGATSASLDVDTDNQRARQLYERLGYQVVRRHVHHWQDLDPETMLVRAEGHSDTWLMRKSLRALSQ